MWERYGSSRVGHGGSRSRRGSRFSGIVGQAKADVDRFEGGGHCGNVLESPECGMKRASRSLARDSVCRKMATRGRRALASLHGDVGLTGSELRSREGVSSVGSRLIHCRPAQTDDAVDCRRCVVSTQKLDIG